MLRSCGKQLLKQIAEVSIDPGNYKGLVTELLPKAVITVDRFHVMKVVNEELDATRKDIKVESLLDITVKNQLKATSHKSKYV